MIKLIEHIQYYPSNSELCNSLLEHNLGVYFKNFKNNSENNCFSIRISEETDQSRKVSIETSYYIGLNYIPELDKRILIEPKINTKEEEIDVLNMLFEALTESENFAYIENLYEIDFKSPLINIHQKNDQLTPFLIIQFIQILQKLVKKGLKKSYYKVEKNLTSRIKGKVLINKQIKTNIAKNKFLDTQCAYEEFGFNISENQFLKYVLSFIKNHLNNYQSDFLNNLKDNINFIASAFNNVDTAKFSSIKSKETNPLYAEYNQLFEIGNIILKLEGFINYNHSVEERNIPPYWIDMSQLFELYVYKKLREIFPGKNEVIYHRKFAGGKETDIIINSNNYKAVIDCKYKPRYHEVDPSLEDKRQIAGYCRLKSVYKILKKPYDEVVTGLIIYNNQRASETIQLSNLNSSPINEYIDMYKLGIALPIITDNNVI